MIIMIPKTKKSFHMFFGNYHGNTFYITFLISFSTKKTKQNKKKKTKGFVFHVVVVGNLPKGITCFTNFDIFWIIVLCWNSFLLVAFCYWIGRKWNFPLATLFFFFVRIFVLVNFLFI